ncbi:hypothetical protein L9F63_021588, partial [Diploptera punctata]
YDNRFFFVPNFFIEIFYLTKVQKFSTFWILQLILIGGNISLKIGMKKSKEIHNTFVLELYCEFRR